LFSALVGLFRSRVSLEAENVALRQQVAVLKQRLGRRRVRLSWRDRMFWVGVSKVWPGWRTALVIVRPETVVRWHREGFRSYWRWKARPRGGRPRIDRETRELIARLQRENPLWGAPRIHGELLMLGADGTDLIDGEFGKRGQDRPCLIASTNVSGRSNIRGQWIMGPSEVLP